MPPLKPARIYWDSDVFLSYFGKHPDSARFAHFRRQIRDLIAGGQKRGDFGQNLDQKGLYIRP